MKRVAQFALILTLLSTPIFAAPITLGDGDFESALASLPTPQSFLYSVADWTYSGVDATSKAGVWRAQAIGAVAYLDPFQGLIIGFLENQANIDQTFVGAANTTYTLSLQVGQRYNNQFNPSLYTIGFFDPSNPGVYLASVNGDSSLAPVGGWMSSPTVQYTTGASYTGQLGVRIQATSPQVSANRQSQLLMDALALDDSPAGVPEPMTMSMIGGGLAGLALLRRRK